MVAVNTPVLIHLAASNAVVTRDIGCWMMAPTVKVSNLPSEDGCFISFL